MSEVDIDNRLKLARKNQKKMQREIKRALLKQNKSRASYLMKRYLNSYDAKLVAIDNANNETWDDNTAKKDTLTQMAETLDPWTHSNKKVHITLEPKERKPDEARPISRFGLKQRACQHLVLGALKPLSELMIKPHQFMFKGGRNKAIEETLKLLDNGFEFLVEIDIVSCYQQFNEEALIDLLYLPKKVVKYVITNSDPYFVIHWNGATTCNGDPVLELEPYASIIPEVLQGIPQGSCLSPTVAEMSLSITDVDLPEDARLINYGDNFLVLAKSQEVVEHAAENLRLALMSHPVGPFSQVSERFEIASDGFEFLGYKFASRDGKFLVKPSIKNMSKILQKIEKRLSNIPDPAEANEDHLERIDSLVRSINGWCGGFTLWKGCEDFQSIHIEEALEVKESIENHIYANEQ